jgi:hypothetical protein
MTQDLLPPFRQGSPMEEFSLAPRLDKQLKAIKKGILDS